MRKLIKNPTLFQGKKYLNTTKTYFEGWYFKNSNNKEGIAFIPGISINKNKQKAFIQIITNNESYFIDYDLKDFRYNDKPFYIKIDKNYFSLDKIYIDVNVKNLVVKGWLNYTNNKNIDSNILSPNIMGPFTFIPFMECNHAILSMKSNVNGVISVNNKKLEFKNANGYVEKDFGVSFPKNYIWMQANDFKDRNVAFMMSIATIPFKIFQFKGLICSLIIDEKEYRFATYNNSKILKCEIDKNNLNIILKKGIYTLYVYSKYKDGKNLLAPQNGVMQKNIKESIKGTVKITLKKNDDIIFKGVSKNCGLEIVD